MRGVTDRNGRAVSAIEGTEEVCIAISEYLLSRLFLGPGWLTVIDALGQGRNILVKHMGLALVHPMLCNQLPHLHDHVQGVIPCIASLDNGGCEPCHNLTPTAILVLLTLSLVCPLCTGGASTAR
jgi:hypothetical protein